MRLVKKSVSKECAMLPHSKNDYSGTKSYAMPLMADQVPIIGIDRFRIGTDGKGITTLVAFGGCSLRCQFCINPESLEPDGRWQLMSVKEVFSVLQKDELYFRATMGGATFGGGEPLLRAEFVKDVLEAGAKHWHTTLETSLNAPTKTLELLSPYVSEFIVDVKDLNSDIYRKYTHGSNAQVIHNLKWLADHGNTERVLCRIPLIEGYNNNDDRDVSIDRLSTMGYTRFEKFKYVKLRS